MSQTPAQRTGGAGRRRNGARAVFIGTRVVAGLLSVILLSASGWGFYLNQVAEENLTRTDALPAQGNVSSEEADPEALNILLVGNDNRSSLTPEQLAGLGISLEPGMNTDTIILLHVPADGTRASFVSFPRDSYVEIPGYGMDKINAAYAAGFNELAPEGSTDAERDAAGSQSLVRTVSLLTGLQIDNFVSINLLGFFELSTILGGIEVNLCEPVKDPKSNIDLPAGVQQIGGLDALAFVRQREGLPRGDIDRIVRQQVFIAGIVRKMLSEEVLFDLGKQAELVAAASRTLTVDRDLDLFALADQMQTVTAGNVLFQTLPYLGDDEDDNGRYILRLPDQATLYSFFANLTADTGASGQPTPPTVAPAEVSVAVLDGQGLPQTAAQAGQALTAAGFVVTGIADADRFDYELTEIRFTPGQETRAATLAAQVPGAVLRADDTVTGSDVQLILGDDFNAIGQPVTASQTQQTGQDPPRAATDTECIN